MGIYVTKFVSILNKRKEMIFTNYEMEIKNKDEFILERMKEIKKNKRRHGSRRE